MNKPTATRPTSLNRIRSLLAFRHQNPIARFVSTLLAFAIATLLVVGSGAAYADDTTPTDTSSSTSTDPATDPAADPATDPAADPAADPAPDSTAPAPDPAPAPAPDTTVTTDPAPSTGTTGTVSRTLQKLAVTPNLNGNAACQSGGNTLVGGFEIDGDPCDDEGGTDFNGGPGDTVDDPFQSKADDSFTGGSSENQDPSTWTINGPQPTGKADIGTVWGWSQTWSNPGDIDPVTPGIQLDPTDGDVFAYFGFTNDSTSGGTQDYSLEFNQHDPSASGLPVRTAGDLLFHFDSNGSNVLEYVASYIYTLKGAGSLPAGCQPITSSSPAAGWCPKPLNPGDWYPKASTSGQYVEAAINISNFFGAGTCSGQFGTMFLRSAPGSYWTSQMKDYVQPLGVTTPSTCASLSIKKYDAQSNTLITGAHFRVWAGTDTSQAPLYNDLSEGSAADKDTTANDGIIKLVGLEPGTYTVREIQAPSGYLIAPACDATHTAPNCDTQTITLAASDNQSLSFKDLKPWQPLTAAKTAHGDYDTTYTWSITKGVRYGADAFAANASHDSANLSESFDWKVSIGEGTRTESNWKVAGNITISNPNSAAVVATVTESLSSCTIYDPADTTPPLTPLADASGAAGFQISVPANGGGSGTAYHYECTQTSSSATSNTVTVSVNKNAYPRSWDDWFASSSATYDAAATAGGTLSPTITWTDHPDGTKVIDVTDVLQGTSTTHANSGAPWTHTWGSHAADPTWNATTQKYEHVYSSPVTTTAGHCASVTNTATITDTGQSASATASHCAGADLTVTKNKTVHLTRTYLWKIDKTRTSAAEITSGQSASYSVTVSHADGAGYADSGWSMDGFITVSNPNDWGVTLTGVTDVYDGNNDATNTCQVTASRANDNAALDGSINYVVPQNGSYQYKYVCSFGAKPDYDGINTATATWSASTAHTPTGTDSGTASVATSDWNLAATPVNKVITVTDDQYTGGSGVGGHTLGTVDWDDAPHTFTYSITWTVPAGTCADKPNTATIVETDQSDSASVKVCNPVDLTVSKTADGSFTRTYLWDLDKKVVGSARSADDSYDHTFDYLVTLKENGVQDSTWKVHGTITVTNNNTDSDIPDYTASVTDAMTGVGGSPSCQWDDGKGEPEAQWPDMPASVTLASGEHADVDYVCSFLSQPTYSGGTNKATATWTGGTASSSDVPVSFAETNSLDKTVHVVDNKTTGTYTELPNSPVTYGSHGANAAWVADDGLYEFAYSVPLSYDPEVGGDCQDFPNTARVLGDGAVVLDHADASVSICPLAGTWEVSKEVAEAHAVAPGTTLHYTLTAHKTSVVDAKGVTVYDDLSDIAPYITGDPVFSDPDASYDSSTHILTWDVGTLSGTETLDFSVVVKSNAYGIDLPNLITSPGSDNCDPQLEGFPADECDTDNVTPHYTLEKSSDAGPQVLPPYLGQPGTLITYTLTVHNDSDAPINSTTMPGEQVTDDLSDVLDNAAWVGNITPSGQAVFDDVHTLTWTLPELAADDGAPGGPDEATLTYQVRVAGDQWDETLTNVAHHGPGGNCVPVAALVVAPIEDVTNCTTTTVTPPYALIQALKVDAETQAPLAGAQFSLYLGTDQTEANLLDTATSGADGVALFDTKLQPGVFTVVETAAPEGYDLPSGEGAVQQVTVTADDLDNGEVPVGVTFGDPPQGALAIAKAHYERNAAGTGWVPSDGQVDFGDEIRYVMTVTATGPKVFHDVEVTDYVPGWNPADHTTAPAGTKAVLESTSIKCGGAFTCTTDPVVNGKIIWHVTGTGQETGDVTGDVVGTVEFVVRMPNIPAANQTPGTSYAAILWNQATLWWTAFGEETPDTHSILSNTVTDAANATLPPEVNPPEVKPPSALPNTGGPDSLLLVAGLVLLLGGGIMVAGDRRRRRRS